MVTHRGSTLTAQQFYALPASDNARELVRGRVVAEPPPRARHGRVAAQIAFLLQRYVRDGGRPGVVLTCDTYFELRRSPATVRGADVAYLSRERYLDLDERAPAVAGAPDLAVEVRSPSRSRRAMREKAGDYLAAGAREVWVVDPDAVMVTVHRPAAGAILLRGDDVLAAPDLLPGFSVRVREMIDLPA